MPGKFIASGMLEAGFDVSYAYRPLHHQLGHAFLNTLLFLDYDRKGFPYPVVPFQVNCYGRRVVAQQAGARGLSEFPSEERARSPLPCPMALLRSRCGLRPGRREEPVAGRADRVLELVARVSDPQALPALPRRRGRPRALRRAAGGRLRGLAAAAVERDRGQRPAGGPELDVPRRRDERARPAADRNLLRRRATSSTRTSASPSSSREIMPDLPGKTLARELIEKSRGGEPRDTG